MFELKIKILNGYEVVGYEVYDGSTSNKILKLEQVQGLAMAGALKNIRYNNRTNKLIGTNGNDLRKLPRKQQAVVRNVGKINGVFTDKELAQLIQNSTKDYKERFVINDITKFLNTTCNGKICALYGLRRTGKTTLMHHAIKRLINKEYLKNIAYITLTKKDTLAQLYKQIDKLVQNGKNYIFIDEITALKGFIQSSALLGDVYSKRGVHIVIAGTDSLIIELAGQNNLYDRMVTIDTTYIGYREYKYLNGNASILDYIHIGGVLPTDIFYDTTRTNQYVTTAISNNIINSLIKSNNRKEYSHLLELEGRGLLRKAIEQAISASNEKLTSYVLTEMYTNRDLGSAKQLMESIFNVDGELNSEEVTDKIRYRLRIAKNFGTEISGKYILELQDFLVRLGVMKKYSRYINNKKTRVYLFTQPGLRYNQTLELMRALRDSPSFFNIPKKIRYEFERTILHGVEGDLIEHEVILSFLEKYKDKNVEITQFNHNGKEVDMLCCTDNSIEIYEIKRSDKITEEQCKWLVDKEFNNIIEEKWGGKIRNRFILYLGDNKDVTLNGKVIQYKNVSDFLTK